MNLSVETFLLLECIVVLKCNYLSMTELVISARTLFCQLPTDCVAPSWGQCSNLAPSVIKGPIFVDTEEYISQKANGGCSKFCVVSWWLFDYKMSILPSCVLKFCSKEGTGHVIKRSACCSRKTKGNFTSDRHQLYYCYNLKFSVFAIH